LTLIAIAAIGLCAGMLAGVMLGRPSKSVILVLGGSPEREKFAAKFALQHPDLPIWVSSGSPKEYSEYVFDQAGIKRDRIHLDYRAVDTVTNFTTLVDDLKAKQITDVYVITDSYHMPRANIIGIVVLGSRGIKMHPVPIPSHMESFMAANPQAQSELKRKVVRDGMRSVIWLLTGSTLNK
jgi:uncharacterized SAM-binding protein YcdF (DUF218 family)